MKSDAADFERAMAAVARRTDWCAVRYVRELTTVRAVRNGKPEQNESTLDEGAMCEVLIDGHFGYAATPDLSAAGLTRAFEQAIATTRAMAPHKSQRFSIRQRPVVTGSYRSARGRALDATGLTEMTDCLLAACAAMALDERLVNRSAGAMLVETQIDYCTSSGSRTQQAFDIVDLSLAATAVDGAESQTRSWTRTGQLGGEVFDRDLLTREGARVAREALALLTAPNCPAGRTDLVLMPDQMMLQIHESIGHPLELDRILGDERNYAGWSFVKPEDFGRLQYGSPRMNVSFDPTRAHELASYAFDDCGNPAQRQMLIERGILKRGLGSLESQARSGLPGVANFRAASWNRAPIDRMANINLEPGEDSLDDLVAQVERGVLMHTNRSWSIDDYRNKFQFGCEYAQIIEEGRLGAVVRNPNYRGITVDFWNRLAAVGRDDAVHGTVFCGKGEPNQLIRVGHAAPPCLFRDVEVFGGEA